MFNVQSPSAAALSSKRASQTCSQRMIRPDILFFLSFLGQEKQYRQGPDAKDQAGCHPEILWPPVMAGDNAAKNRIEKMDQRRRVQQRRGIDVWLKKNESGEIP